MLAATAVTGVRRGASTVVAAGFNDFDVRQIDRFEATSEILMGRGPKPAGDPNAFDASEVIANLGPQLARPM